MSDTVYKNKTGIKKKCEESPEPNFQNKPQFNCTVTLSENFFLRTYSN